MAVLLSSLTLRTGEGEQKTKKRSVDKKEKVSILSIFVLYYLLLISFKTIFLFNRLFIHLYDRHRTHTYDFYLLRNRG